MRRTLVVATLVVTGCTLQQTTRSGAPIGDEHLSHVSAADLAAPIGAPSVGENAAQQGTAGLPPSNATAAARLAASPRHGEWVKFPLATGSGDSIMAWVVHPSRSGRAPVMVVVHEIAGLATWVRAVADQVAAEGFVAIAPDFLSRARGGPSSSGRGARIPPRPGRPPLATARRGRRGGERGGDQDWVAPDRGVPQEEPGRELT